jgi:hypothetical protein
MQQHFIDAVGYGKLQAFGHVIDLDDPLWLMQQWIIAVFEASMTLPGLSPYGISEGIASRNLFMRAFIVYDKPNLEAYQQLGDYFASNLKGFIKINDLIVAVDIGQSKGTCEVKLKDYHKCLHEDDGNTFNVVNCSQNLNILFWDWVAMQSPKVIEYVDSVLKSKPNSEIFIDMGSAPAKLEKKPAFALIVANDKNDRTIGTRFDNHSNGVSRWDQLVEVDDVLRQLSCMNIGGAYKNSAASALGFGKTTSRTSASNNLLIAGPAGVCKTTLGRRLALDMAKEYFPHYEPSAVFVSAAELVGEHIGEAKTYASLLVDKCEQDILFIDEIDQLLVGDDSYGRQVLGTLNAKLGLGRQFPVVVATLNEANLESFYRAENGLRSRFPKLIRRGAYSEATLLHLFDRMVQGYGAECGEGVAAKIRQMTQVQRKLDGSTFGNGRFVENLWRVIQDEREARLEAEYSADAIAGMTEEQRESLRSRFAVLRADEIPDMREGEFIFSPTPRARGQAAGAQVVELGRAKQAKTP